MWRQAARTSSHSPDAVIVCECLLRIAKPAATLSSASCFVLIVQLELCD